MRAADGTLQNGKMRRFTSPQLNLVRNKSIPNMPAIQPFSPKDKVVLCAKPLPAAVVKPAAPVATSFASAPAAKNFTIA
jgi:hypothetical protein